MLRNTGLLRGTQIYLDEDLAFSQQGEQRKEWEKVKTARSDVGLAEKWENSNQ